MRALVPALTVAMAATAFAAPAYAQQAPYCGAITCRLPPTAYCDQPCLTCLGDVGDLYDGFPSGNQTCQYPILTTVREFGCACLERTACASDPATVSAASEILGRGSASAPAVVPTAGRPANRVRSLHGGPPSRRRAPSRS